MKRFKNILCVVAEGCANEIALERAATLAKQNSASLTLVKVIDEIPPDTRLFDRTLFPEIKTKIVGEHQKGLEEMVSPWRKQIEIEAKVIPGIQFIEIIREVLSNQRDLVIKASEIDGVFDRVFGSDDMHLLRKCPCPVWLANSKLPKDHRRIVAAVDVDDSFQGSENEVRHLLNIQILETASSLALSEGAILHVLHVWHAIDEKALQVGFAEKSEAQIAAYIEELGIHRKQKLSELIDECKESEGKNPLNSLSPKLHLVEGAPRRSIPVFVNGIEADLLVMGTVARTGIPGFFMGNTAEAIYNNVNCSTLALKPKGFATPVTLQD